MNKLLTKIVGAALGLTMTIGVGVAVANSNNGVTKAEAETATLVIDGSQLTSTATTEDTDKTYSGYTICFSTGAKQQSSDGTNKFTDKAILIGKSGAYIYNKTALPDNITKFEIYANKGASAKVSIGVNFSATAIASYNSSAANTYTETLSTVDHVYDATSSLASGTKYFWYQVTNANNSQVEFRITYTTGGGGGDPTPSGDETTAGSASITLGTGSGQWNARGENLSTTETTCNLTWTVAFTATDNSGAGGSGYIQYGSSSKPVTALSFTSSAFTQDLTLSAFSVSYGGSGSGAASKATLYVNSTSLKAGNGITNTDTETVSWTGSQTIEAGDHLYIGFSDLAKGTKVSSISYTLTSASGNQPFVTLSLTTPASSYKGETVTVSAVSGNLEGSGLTWTVTAGTVTSITSSNSGFSGTLGSTGTVTIKAQDNGGDTSDSISVSVAAITLSLNKNSTSIAQGRTETLSATTNHGSVNWTCTGNAKVSVSSAGVVSVAADAVVSSTATVTATSALDSTVSASCTVTVIEPSPVVDITYSSYSGNLPASGYATVDWSSDGIVGKVYSISNGNGYIQFQANASFIYNTLAISGYIKSITIDKASGSYSQLTAFVADSEGGAITEKPASGGTTNNSDWTWNFDASNHYCYFRIDATSSGAKYFSSISITYEKVEKVDPTGIVLDNNSSISMDTYGYGRRRLSATVEPFNNNDPTVNWGTSNSSVVTVADGILTAVGVGSATVYATTGNYVSDVATPELKASVSVTVTQALYKKATFVPTNTDSAIQTDDYLAGGSVTVSSNGSWNTDKSLDAIQIAGGKSATFTISGYAGMKITGIDLVMSSNGNAGTGSLTVTAGSTDILDIETAPFSDSSWNGAYDANPCDIYEDTSDYVVANSETITFAFSATVNSLFIHSVSIRYLDYSLEQWCESFLAQITCDGGNPGNITDDSNWNSLATSFASLGSDLKTIAAEATANKDSDNVIEQAMARYDLILRKYGIGTGSGQHTDFIGRFGVGTVNGPLGSAYLGINVDNSNIVIVVITLSLITLTTIGAYYFLRKRKEQ